MKKLSRLLIMTVAVLLVFSMAAPALAEGEETSQPTQTATAEPTPEPTPDPTPEPTQAPTQEPTQAPTQEPTQAPTQEPTQAPPQEPTQAPAQDTGKVDITIYAYTEDNQPADGYTVKIDETKLVAGKDGMVEFKDVTVEQHNIYLIAPDGVESVGVLYMSRGSVTVITDQAMGGKYGLDIAQGATHIYMDATFAPRGAILLSGVSESAPAKPAATASSGLAQPAAAKKLTALFLDADDRPLKGMGVQVTPENGMPTLGQTNGSGEFVLNGAEYGVYQWAVTPDGVSGDDAVAFEVELKAGVQTGIAQSEGSRFVVNVAPAVDKVFLQFRQSGDRFVLEKASESGGGLNSMVLGIIIVAVVAAVIVVIVAVNRKKKKGGYVKKTYQRESPAARMQGEAPPRKTGGSNKFDDRSRM